VGKVKDRALQTATGFTDCFTDTIEFYRSLRSFRVFLGVVFAFATATDHVLLCLYAGPTFSIALMIVHFDSTSTLPLYNILIYKFESYMPPLDPWLNGRIARFQARLEHSGMAQRIRDACRTI
jgi:hypothetical protein